MKELYAQALWNLANKSHSGESKADIKAIVGQVAKHLKESGRLKLLSAILTELKHIEAREAKLASVVEVASEKEAAVALKAAASHGIHAESAIVNDSLITGWRATGKVNGVEKLIDNSSKRALIELYQSVTN